MVNTHDGRDEPVEGYGGREPSAKGSLICDIDVFKILAVAVLWSFVIVPFTVASANIFSHSGVPHFEIVMPAIDFVFRGAALAAALLLFRCGSGYRIRVSLDRRDLWICAALVAAVVAINARVVFGGSLVCDEIYHASRGALFLKLAYPAISSSGICSQMPMSYIDRGLSFVVVATGFVLVWYILRLGRSHPRSAVAFSALIGLLWIVGTVFEVYDIHPPLRLLPITALQLLCGLDAWTARLPSALVAAIAIVTTYLSLRRLGGVDVVWCALLAISLALVPSVMQAARYAEPSIWHFTTAICCFWALRAAVVTGDQRALVIASIIVAIGAFARISVLVLWAPVVMIGALMWWRSRVPLRMVVASWLPMLCFLPLVVKIVIVGYPAMAGEAIPPLDARLPQTLWHQAVMVARTSGALWLLIGCGCLVYAVRSRTRGLLPMLTIAPAFVLFAATDPNLVGLGRYQAEFIAPYICWAIIAAFISLGSASRPFVFAMLVVGLSGWPESHFGLQYVESFRPRRAITELEYPYDEAFRYLHRQEAHGRFAFIGASPLYGDFPLYSTGMSPQDINEYGSHESLNVSLWSSAVPDYRQYVDDPRIDYLVIAHGDQSDRDSASSGLRSFFDDLTAARGSDFVPEATFIGTGGVVTVLRRRDMDPFTRRMLRVVSPTGSAGDR
ncbi:MAG: hypothetical protein H0V44_03300 [Planctomycetes bacterium]|nr:hypothetical protein [Planctomycetota bacterium]